MIKKEETPKVPAKFNLKDQKINQLLNNKAVAKLQPMELIFSILGVEPLSNNPKKMKLQKSSRVSLLTDDL